MNLALFDIDGTLVTGRSEVLFWRHLARRGRQGPVQLLSWLARQARRLPAEGLHAARANKAYLRGLQVEDVAALATEFVKAELVRLLYPPAVERLRRHADRGDLVVLLSGTIDPVARALAVELEAGRVCATQCPAQDGAYSGAAPSVHPFGETKRELALQLAREVHADLQEAAAYGDSHHDLPLLEAVGRPVAVRPDRRLEAVARGHDWEILNGDRLAKPVLRGQEG